ncbi:hypothetical protein [uncultured Lamprocystis sp.]|jgi:hypothetical protein|uniref:hypothetical protein n=1 Tax=uncultured Lamprocystis sp. TaxID=543132 RepID=UPI0025EE2C4E|nr:hypothetical protein [uncultured Lamprocystis sp.]
MPDWLMLAVAFLVFMGLIITVQAVDRHAAGRFGYRPFALTNLAFMLIPHGLLAAWLITWWSTGHPAADAVVATRSAALWAPAVLGTAMAIGLFLILWRRTSAWIALFAVPVMAAGASVLLVSGLFGELARAGAGQDH